MREVRIGLRPGRLPGGEGMNWEDKEEIDYEAKTAKWCLIMWSAGWFVITVLIVFLVKMGWIPK